MSLKKKIFITFLLLIILVTSALFGYGYFMVSNVTRSTLSPEELKINKMLDTQVINIALFGIDGRDDEEVEGDRTDSILIGSLDLRDNSVKVVSIMRDTFAKICYPDGVVRNEDEETGTETQTQNQELENQNLNGENQDVTLIDDNGNEIVIDDENRDTVAEYTKINAAYSEGGVEASIATLNQNFDLNIQDYITVDFNCLMDLVDAVGGVELEIPNQDVLYWTNEYLKESNHWGNRQDPEIQNIGVQTLTGAQALAFARNRYSDSDFGRSMRQREVVQAIFNKVKTEDVLTILNLANKIYPYVQTSLSLSEITQYTSAVLKAQDLQFQGFQVPTNTLGTAGFIKGEWFLFPDTLVKNCVALHHFLYGENTDYVPSSRVEQISAVINYDLDNIAYDKTEHIGGESDDVFDGTERETVESEVVEGETPQEEVVTQEGESTQETVE